MEESVNMEDGNNLFRSLNSKLTEEDMLMLSPLQLAYLGDAVYELLIRTYLLEKDRSVNDLHRAATRYARAQGQSKIYHLIEEELTERERQLVRRGRNAKSHTSPKNVDFIDYKYATGLEALIGYLYISGQEERLLDIFHRIIDLKIS